MISLLQTADANGTVDVTMDVTADATMDAMETDCLISGAETETVAAFSGSWSFWLAAEIMMAVAAETMTTTTA